MLFDSWAGVLSPSLFRAHVTGPRARSRGVSGSGFPMCR